MGIVRRGGRRRRGGRELGSEGVGDVGLMATCFERSLTLPRHPPPSWEGKVLVMLGWGSLDSN